MKKKTNSFLFRTILITSLLLISFLLHFTFLEQPNLVVLLICYAFNWAWTIAFIALVSFGSEKHLRQLGFLFLYMSIGKFGFFLFLIKPMLTLDLGVRSEHFAFFFVPYAISMVYETVSTVRAMNAK